MDITPFDSNVGLTDDDPLDPYAPEVMYEGADPDTWGPDGHLDTTDEAENPSR
ncbi:MAG: hypothetical protein ACRDJP_01695 [Actinomycetota bacterium]